MTVSARLKTLLRNSGGPALGSTLTLAALIVAAAPARGGDLVISQIYGAGGNAGATRTHDYIEIFNRGSSAVSLNGLSLQYASATGTGNFGASSTQLTELPNVSLQPGQYYLVQQAGGAVGAPLPAADHIDATPIAMAAGAGKVALVTGTTTLGCNGGSLGCDPAALARILDLVGYGNANFFEGAAAAPTLSATTAAFRAGAGCTDSNNNASDFSAAAPAPRNTAATLNPCGGGDVPPTVTGTSPAAGASNVSPAASITVDFSEAVTASGSWFDISCVKSGPHTASVSGGPQSYTLDPDADFVFSESCTVRVYAAQVTDQDGAPQNMGADFVFSFTTAAQPFGACGDAATFIHTVQGSGASSPLNSTVGAIVEGVVVGDYQGSGQFGGFHVQEEDADADGDPATSEGIFVFNTSFPVNPGDKVRVRGTVTEFALLTQLTSVSALTVCGSGHSVTPAAVNLPVGSIGDWEALESMLIELPQELTVTETFTLGRFGEVALSVNGRLLNPTAVTTPGPLAIAQQDLNNRSRILLDDGNNQQNVDPTLYPSGGLSASNTLRSGATVNDLTGVLEQRFNVYRVQPVGPVVFNPANPRPAEPAAVGGSLRVAAMNVLNYFTTLDVFGAQCGPALNLDCRGANSLFEFTRQRDKIVNAILGLDADVVGLMEVENNATAAIGDLVDGLNAASAPGTYAFVNTGTIGTDAIKVGLIYRPATVTPVGAHAILDSTVDPTFIDTLNRPVLAQTFREIATGERFTVAVNHLKSKGSDCNAAGDPDTGDGQGNCNVTRTSAATAVVNWLATDPTGSGDTDYLIIGDLNSYAMEDPITAITNAGYVNLIDTFLGPAAYSYVFQGQSGYLDHALASPSLASQASGATEWHANADEPIVLDYNVEFKTANQVNTFYDPGPYRSSDHDPLVVGLNLDQTPPTIIVQASPNVLWPPNHRMVPVVVTISTSDTSGNVTCEVTGVSSNEPENGLGDGDMAPDWAITGDVTLMVRAERSGRGDGRVYTIAVRCQDASGNVATASTTVNVPHNK